MKVYGSGESESLHKALRKDEGKKGPPQRESGAKATSSRSDAVQISPEARLFGKLKQMPEVRPEVIDRVMKKIDDGTLLNREAVRDGILKFMQQL